MVSALIAPLITILIVGLIAGLVVYLIGRAPFIPAEIKLWSYWLVIVIAVSVIVLKAPPLLNVVV